MKVLPGRTESVNVQIPLAGDAASTAVVTGYRPDDHGKNCDKGEYYPPMCNTKRDGEENNK
jgi:hypothetical protein